MFPSSVPARCALALVLAVVSVQAWGQPAGRLDPDERQRLRGELRQQMHEERARMRAERLIDRPADRPAGSGAGHWAGGRWVDPAPGTPQPVGNGPFGPLTEGTAPPGSHPYPPPGLQRLSPDEREQLRRQLREARYHHGR